MTSLNLPKIAIIPGDGIGPEVIRAALQLVPTIDTLIEPVFIDFKESVFPLDKFYTPSILDRIDKCDHILAGAFTTPSAEMKKKFSSAILFLRNRYKLSINIRPFFSIKNISKSDFDIVILRQNSEGLYGQNQYFIDKETAIGEKKVTYKATEEIATYAYHFAVKNRKKTITIVTKSNVLYVVDKFFRDIVYDRLTELNDYHKTDITIHHEYVDACAYKLVKHPNVFDIIVTMNLYGDILSDLMAGMMGSLGLCPSQNYHHTKSMFEPIHGSAPDIAGLGIANPTGAILSLGMLLDTLGYKSLALAIRQAILHAMRDIGTPDMNGTCTTDQYVDHVRSVLEKIATKDSYRQHHV